MLKQVLFLHPDSDTIHIGADEAYSFGKDKRCLDRLESAELKNSTDRLKLSHISRL